MAARVSGVAIQSLSISGEDNPSASASPQEAGPTVNTVKEKNIQYIVDGIETDRNSWPFAASILFERGKHYYHYCGGSLIRKQWVLTAAHCQPSVGDWVLLGRHDLREENGLMIKVTRVLPHPNYNSSSKDNDLALVRLESTVDLDFPLLRFDVPPAVGQKVTAIGWGAISTDGNRSAVLRQVTVPISDQSACIANYLKHQPSFSVTENMICAGDQDKDSCQGDSGGPLLGGDPAAPSQVGIVSFGWRCGQRSYPGIYTRVDHYIHWIEMNAV